MSIKIATARLILRPWKVADIEQLVSGLNNLELAKWMAFVPHPYSRSDAKNWIEKCQEISKTTTRPIAYEFAVELKSEGTLIGGVSLNKLDWQEKTGGGGIWIAKDFQRNGYGSEAFTAKIDFAFRDLGLTKLVNGYLEGNENSWAMQSRLGYRLTGKAPAKCMADGRQTTERITTLLRTDWDNRQNSSHIIKE